MDTVQPTLDINHVVFTDLQPLVDVEQVIFTDLQPSVDIEQILYTDLQPVVDIQHVIYDGIEYVISVKQVIFTDLQEQVDIQHVIGYYTVQPTGAIQHTIAGSVRPAVDTRQVVYAISPDQGCMDPSVTVNGSDYSAYLTGTITMSAGESVSGIAQFTLLDSATLTTNDVVQISINDGRGRTVPRFTGLLAGFVPDIDQGVINCTVSTHLQGKIEAMTREQIQELVETINPESTPGVWSKTVFGEYLGKWEYFQDCMSTVPGEVHVDREGFVKVEPWSSGASAATYSSADRFHNTLKVDYVDRAELVNKNSINIDYRFDRRVMKQGHISWNIGMSTCELLGWGQEAFFGLIPTKDMVESAFTGIGWDISNISWTQLPEPGAIQCGAGKNDYIAWVGGADHLVIGASAALVKTFDVTVTHHHTVIVECTDSQDVNGIIAVEEKYGVKAEEELVTDKTRDGGALFTSSSGSSAAVYAEWGNYATLVDGHFGGTGGDGDYYDADGDYTLLDECIDIAVKRAKTEMRDAHRQSAVSFDVPFSHDVWLDSVIRISSGITAEGKVSGVVDTIDTATGEATTKVTLAVSGVIGQGLGESTELETVTVPEHAQPLTFSFYVGTRFNELPPDNPQPEDSAYYTQRLVPVGTVGTELPPYNVNEFLVVGPTVTAEETEPVDEYFERSIEVAIPVDTFALGALHTTC